MTAWVRKAWLVALAVTTQIAGACLSPSSVVCSDGKICPAGSRCTGDAHHPCATPSEAAACAGLAEGAACTVAGSGICHAGICEPFPCGDGVRNGSEACDSADLGGQTCTSLHFYAQTSGLACTDKCMFDTSGCSGYCGDGVRNGGEACDGADLGGQTCASLGYYTQTSPPRCKTDCTLDTSGCTGFCGDGILNGSEQCDGKPTQYCVDQGYDYGFTSCSASCQNSFDGCVKLGDWRATQVPGGTVLSGLWGSGPDDVYAVGQSAVLHWDGTTWSTTSRAIAPAPAVNLFAVWGSGPNDVFVVGGASSVFHWDGARWSQQSLTVQPLSVWGSGPNDVFAVGAGISHWNGASWTPMDLTAIADGYLYVWGSGPHDVYITGGRMGSGMAHWDGTAWSPIDVSSDIGHSRLWGSGPNDIFAVGVGGVINHWDGTAWSPMVSGVTTSVTAIWGSSSQNVVAVGGDLILRWDGKTWTTKSFPTASLAAVWVGGGREFAGGNTILSLFETQWGAFPFTGTPPALEGVWSPGPDDLFAVGTAGTLAHWDGNTWSTATVDARVDMHAVWGNGPSDVLAVGDNPPNGLTPTLAHWDGSGWSRPPASPSLPIPGGLSGVWSSGPTNIYVAGHVGSSDSSPAYGCLLQSDGSSWSDVTPFPAPSGLPGGPPPPPIPTTAPEFSRVWGTGPDDVYLLAADYGAGGLSHWNGSTWSLGFGPYTDGAPLSVWASGPHDVLVTDNQGYIGQWDGSSWTSTFVPNSLITGFLDSPLPLYAVAGSGPGDVFVAGDNVLFHRRAGTWDRIALPVTGSVRGLWVTPSRVTLVGSMGEIHLDRPSVTCVGPEQDCSDGWDNDCDGLIDGDDPDCAGRVTEQCSNQIDDDGDGLVDCADPDCASFTSCRLSRP